MTAVDLPTVVIVGRPNVGKSTLFNRLVGDDRSVVHDLPGTTRDSIDTLVETEDGPIRYVDTAGMRRRSRIDEATEYYGLVRALESVDRADAANSARVAVVNESFVRNVLGGRQAIGRRLKYLWSSSGGQRPPQQQWLEIVGVVRDLGVRELVVVGRGDVDEPGLAYAPDEPLHRGDRLLGATHVQLPLGEHEVDLGVDVPQDQAAQVTRSSRSLGRSRRPTFADGFPSVRTMSAVKSLSPRMSDEPTP